MGKVYVVSFRDKKNSAIEGVFWSEKEAIASVESGFTMVENGAKFDWARSSEGLIGTLGGDWDFLITKTNLNG